MGIPPRMHHRHGMHAEKYHHSLNPGRVLTFVCLLVFLQSCAGDSSDLCLPQNNTLWHGAFPPIPHHINEMEITHESINSYIHNSGKSLALIAFSHEWSVDRSFPYQQVWDIHESGAIPYIRLMLRSDNRQYRPEPVFTLKRIKSGAFDTDLRNFAKEAKKLGFPILIEYGTEVNGWWFSWNGYWTGKENGAELFQSVYRHIISLMREEGADNLYWVFHINWHSNPEEQWNIPQAYYPGDEFIDMIGISAYGALSPHDKNISPFTKMMDEGYRHAQNISPEKPVIVSEMGTDLNNPYIPAKNWTYDALSALMNDHRWPNVVGFVWWNAAWPNDTNKSNNTTMRIEESREIRDIIRGFLTSDTILGTYCPQVPKDT